MTPLLSSTLLRTQSDERLVTLASNGHERAFEAIVERYRRPLLRWCRGVLPEARAEDAVQMTFLKAWTAIEAGTQVSDLKPWLYRIARNAALDNARKAGYDYDELSGALRMTPGPQDDVERRHVIRETLAGVAGLPANQREALLRTASGHSRADIARELHVSEGAVRQLVHRARTTLRAAATAITPYPLVSWASALGADAGAPTAQRIAELATGAGSAGVAATAVKAGTVIVAAGVLVAGPGMELRHEVSNGSQASASQGPGAGGAAGSSPSGANQPGDDHGGQGGSDRGRGGRGSSGGGHGLGGGGTGNGPRRERSGSSGSFGSGRSGDDSSNSGSGSSGSGRSGGDGGGDHSGPGSSGSGSGDDSGSGGGSSSSGPGPSGSGSGGGGTSEVDTSGSGSSGSDSSDGSGTSRSGSSGSGSDGSGSGDLLSHDGISG